MLEIEDWLQDPLRKIKDGKYSTCKLKAPKDDKQNDVWFSFHFATRLKLNGADFFCRQALGAASMPDKLGLPLLAYNQTKWYLDALFFELMSACDTLLQELNVVYSYDSNLKLNNVRWSNWKEMKKKLPTEITNYLEGVKDEDWFCKLQNYRHQTTHHYYVPLGSYTVRWGDTPSKWSAHNVSMYYEDKKGNIKSEDITKCTDYIDNVVQRIRHVWGIMSEEFE